MLGNEEDPSFLGYIERAKRGDVLIDTPRLVGFSILEISKLITMRTHYRCYKETYGDKCTLLFTDTDSLAYIIETENVVADMVKCIKHPSAVLFDIIKTLTPAELDLMTNKNKKIIKEILDFYKAVKGILGALKFESGHSHMLEFVGLAAKLYNM